MGLPTLQEIVLLKSQSRRLQRYLQILITDPENSQRLEANNLLGVHLWHQGEFSNAIITFKKTIGMEPHGVEAVWAMKMLSHLYRRLGLKAERARIDLKRLQALRRLLYYSEEDEKVRFAYLELLKECDDRDILGDKPEIHFDSFF